MRLLRWTALLLVLLWGEECSGSSSSSPHSLRYFDTAVSDPGPGLPRVVTVGYVDGQRFMHYDSDAKRARPAAPWAEKHLEEKDPGYWDGQTQILQGNEAGYRVDLETLRSRYNQSGGFHTLQSMYGCELREDRTSKGRYQYGYDGRDFIAFDKETLTWTAADAKAQITKGKWEAEPAFAQRWKAYLEEICIEWLQKYLRYGNQTLLRKEPPTVKVTRKDSREDLETLLCQAHGFYPKEIDVVWRKDGEVRQEDTFRGVVSPNADGTYYTWLSIDIDPKDRSRFRCHVDHNGLLEPLDVALEERTWPASVPVWLIAVGVVSVVVATLLLVAGMVFYAKKRPGKAAYSAASASDQGSDSSSRA